MPVGTRVQLIDQPVKYSVEPDGSHWLEVHEPLSRNRAEFESDRKVPLPMTSALRELLRAGSESFAGRADPAAPLRHAGEYQRHSGAGKFVAGRLV